MNWHQHPLDKKLMSLDTMLVLLMIITLGVSLQQYLLPDREFFGAMRPHYNNYLIFKYSFPHLIQNLNLYTAYPTEYGDLYKYSPTFAVGMGVFYWIPDWLGIILWNLLNVLCLFIAIKMIPQFNQKSKVFLVLFVLFELIGNLQNEQSNALITGFVLLTFVFFERKNLLIAALFVTLAFYVKIFGIVAAALFLLYPKRQTFLMYLGMWLCIFGALPLLIISPVELFSQYENWLETLRTDLNLSVGFSLVGVLQKWFGLNPSKWLITGLGIVIFCLGYIRVGLYKNTTFRYLFLASILIWIVIFNHKAESPTYIIAMTGIGIWFFSQKSNPFNISLLIIAFIFVSFTLTDLFPKEIRTFLYDYYVKTIPAIIIWTVVIYQMATGKYLTKLDFQNDAI